ncbi:mechanosensitive ion channel family protein [Geochorda subterranea]|uniref:Mechanosensitive ion channel family protein n=1 Tax=Geochorda subterranea TaxID=3109564 RepID=A0ABZ1BTN6_9FIRM|nr:mechanosensitive ion channel family protein [Limnochorda sp. LNt]WRP15487.1 mechanosensitive ion channel family protein [Limnochorda sp. LNt]
MALPNVLQSLLTHNTLWRWVLAAVIFVAVYAGLDLAKRIGQRRLAAQAEATHSAGMRLAADLLGRRSNRLVFAVLALYAASLALEVPGSLAQALRGAAVVALFLQGALLGNGLIQHGVSRAFATQGQLDPEAASVVSLVALAARLVLWTLVLLVVLRNVGIDITALVAGLGVAGIAVALAVQNVLGDLFAALSIILDKPFVVGDFIVVGDYLGTVERIGLKTIRIRSLWGEQLVFSNADLLNSRIRNYKRMEQRRIAFTVAVSYETPYEKLAAIPAMLREIVESQQSVRFDRAHFARYADHGLVFEIVYYVLSPDYTLYMDIQQRINLEIHRRFQAEGIRFALPVRTVYLAGERAAS